MRSFARTATFCFVLFSAAAHGQALNDHDNSPLAGILGLADATEGGDVLPGGQQAWAVYIGTASHSVAEASGGEAFIADGETTRLELTWRRGFGDRWDLGLEMPYLTHQSGGLDSIIEDWHSFFGLPDGARDDRPRDVLEYAYANGGSRQLGYGSSEHGIGDLRLLAGYRLKSTPAHAVALRVALKLPTGDAESLLGSGAADLSVGIAGELREFGGSATWSAFYRLHGVLLGEPEYLADRHRSFVAQAAGGLSWQAHERLALTVQASVRSAAYDSRIEMLGDTAIALTFGGHVRLTDRLRVAIGVGEDVKVESTPDVTFHIALQLDAG